MKFLQVALGCLLFPLAALTQPRWEVCLNQKTLLKTGEENEQKNVIHLPASDLQKKNQFLVQYLEATGSDWERTIMLFDENDHELTRQKGTCFALSGAALLSFFRQTRTLKIYTWALPLDPKRKAAIRVRRVHLCTLIPA